MAKGTQAEAVECFRKGGVTKEEVIGRASAGYSVDSDGRESCRGDPQAGPLGDPACAMLATTGDGFTLEWMENSIRYSMRQVPRKPGSETDGFIKVGIRHFFSSGSLEYTGSAVSGLVTLYPGRCALGQLLS